MLTRLLLAFSGLAFGLALLLLVPFRPSPASASVAFAQAPSDSPRVCPLSDDQAQKAVQAFAPIARAFTQQPRCVNCHGAIDPFATKTGHVGGRIPLVFKSAQNPNGGSPAEVTEVDDKATNEQCEECHSAFPETWRMAPQPLFFAGKSTVQLCKQQKIRFSDPPGLFVHLTDDPFIKEGFKGTRALDEVGQALSVGPYPDPPKGVTQAELIKDAQDWSTAQKDLFQGDADCGCVVHHYAVNVDSQTTVQFNQGIANAQSELKSSVAIPIKINDDASFTGQAQETRHFQAKLTVPSGFCTSEYDQDVTWKVSGTIDDKNQQLHMKVSFSAPSTPITAHCTVQGMTITRIVPLAALDTSSMSTPLSSMDLSSEIGTTKAAAVDWPNAHTSLTLTINQTD